MKKVLIFIFGCALLCACNNQAKLEREAQEKYEKEAAERERLENERYEKVVRLVRMATGVTSTVREERKTALFRLMEKYPKLEAWEEVNKCIEDGKFYEGGDQLIYDIKKLEGWVDSDLIP